jgi:DNA repair protein RadC
MYDLSLIENSNVVKAMLWDPDRVLPALYELRNRNLVAKISEIDNVRQFTLKWTLEEMVANLASMASGPTG